VFLLFSDILIRRRRINRISKEKAERKKPENEEMNRDFVRKSAKGTEADCKTESSAEEET